MPTLLLRFPARRYHATPYGHHVNEGVIEWPPSPWRLLRALLSVGYTTQGWPATFGVPTETVPPAIASGLICKLASVLPAYVLPSASAAHTRHYMPLARLKDGREDTTLVFDTWAHVEAGELAVTWNVSLSDDETRLLAALADALPYLGRSESWVVARLADPAVGPPMAANCFPSEGVAPPGTGWQQVGVMAPESAAVYDAWRAERTDALLEALPVIPMPIKAKGQPTAKERKPTEHRDAERQHAVAPYPADLIACLQADTAWLRSHGWSQPPGSRRVSYWRQADALNASPIARVNHARSAQPTVPFVLLALTTASGNDHPLPTLARSLPQGERLHGQMVGTRLRLAPDDPPTVLSGCDATRRPLRGAHGHAHVLSLDLDGDEHIDHFLVWAPDGLDALDQRALRATRDTYAKGRSGTLRLVFSAAGDRRDLCRMPPPQGVGLARVIASSCHWVSATPFVPPRHLKPHGANSAEGQLLSELATRGFPKPCEVRWLDPRQDERARRLRHHVRVRAKGTWPPVNVGIAWQIIFDAPVEGPICLGYGSHFGLGRFEASSASST